jgi:hypothetical protein
MLQPTEKVETLFKIQAQKSRAGTATCTAFLQLQISAY